ASQAPIHREWGGVVPELASRQHIRDICGVVERALKEARAGWADLGAIAVTQGPGLVGSLLVGVSFAKAAAVAAGLPLVAVHRLARGGNDRAIALPTTRLTHADRNAPDLKGDLDFSFSGLKTAVARYVKSATGSHPMSETEVADVCASFQRIVVTGLLDRLFDAARRCQARSIGVAGGVSANSRLRVELADRGSRREMPTFLPSLQLSTDNAAMIAAAGLRRYRAGIVAPADLNADAALPLQPR